MEQIEEICKIVVNDKENIIFLKELLYFLYEKDFEIKNLYIKIISESQKENNLLVFRGLINILKKYNEDLYIDFIKLQKVKRFIKND